MSFVWAAVLLFFMAQIIEIYFYQFMLFPKYNTEFVYIFYLYHATSVSGLATDLQQDFFPYLNRCTEVLINYCLDIKDSDVIKMSFR